MADITHIKDLKPDQRNARKHNARNIGMIEDALNEVGAARSIVIDEDGNILAGNGTVEAAAQAGGTYVAVNVEPKSIKPRRKPTAAEHAERVDFVAAMLARVCTRSEIHKAVKEKYGDLHWRTADRYMVRAREQLHKQASLTKTEAMEIGLSVILGVIKTGTPTVRIRAEERLASIMGYDAPKRSEYSGPGGLPIQTAQVHIDMAAVQRRVAEAVEGEERMRLLEERGLVIVPPIEGGGNGNGHNGDDSQDG